MTTEDQISDGKLQYDINREAYQQNISFISAKLISMSILLVKKYYLLINSK